MINIYNNKYFLNKQKCNIVTIWIMLLVITLLIFLNIAFNYKYKKYDEYIGYIKKINGSFNLVFYVMEEEVSEVYKNSLLVDGSKYNFSIKSISEEYYLIDNKNYYEVILNVNLDKNLLIENNIVNIVFEKDFTTLYKEFKKGIRKWLS